MQIIGFAGKSGSGKTTAAGILSAILSEKGNRVQLDTFAYPIRKMAEAEFGCLWKECAEQRSWMQRMGSLMRRSEPYKLISQFYNRNDMGITGYPPADFLIVHDVRYPNEYEFCREYGIVIYMQGTYRPLSIEHAAHDSEILVEDLLHGADHLIPHQQEGSISHLTHMLERLVEAGGHLKRECSRPVS